MEQVILIIHIILAITIIGLVLIQKGSGGGLGIGGGGAGGLTTARGAANILTKATTWCAILFFGTSLILAILAGTHSSSVLDELEAVEGALPTAIEAPALPEVPAGDNQPAEIPTAP